MKKKWLIGIIVIGAVIAVVVFIFIFGPKKEAYMPKESGSTSAPAQEQTSTAQNIPASTPGKYVDYTDDVIANTSGTKVLFFHAPWCPQCRALEASIQAGKIPDGVTIIKVDYDSHEKLRKKYGVTIQTTLVRVNDNGDLIKRFVAYSTPSLDALINNVL